MNRWVFVIAVTAIVVGFQNCAKTNLNEAQSTGANIGTGEYNKTDAKDFKKVTLPDYSKNQYLDLDLKSGKLVAFENLGEIRGDQYCLNDQELLEIQNLLAESQVCEPVADASKVEGQVCTMIYQYPYAMLIDSKHEIRLGEKNNGCDAPVDLCGDAPKKLKVFIDKILKSLKDKSC